MNIYIETILSVVIFSLQLYFFLKTKKDINVLNNLYPDFNNSKRIPPLRIDKSFIKKSHPNGDIQINDHNIEDELEEDNDNYVNQIIMEKKANNSLEFLQILRPTNKYLLNNQQTTTDFNILKGISQRISNSYESIINSTIALPLYLGLMGTFIGVILGLVIIFLQDGKIDENTISGFLGGVFIAMIASLFGLIFTTTNNSYFFKRAKTERDNRENEYYTFLQTELLPVMTKDMPSSLVNLGTNLERFNSEFSNNIGNFKGTIPNVTKNIKLQIEFFKELKKINFKNIADENIKVFDKLEETTPLFEALNNYAENFDRSLKESTVLAEKIQNLLNRFSDFENEIKNLGENFKINDAISGKGVKFIEENLGQLQNRYDLIKQHFNSSDEELKKFLLVEKDTTEKLTQNRRDLIQQLVNFSEDEIKKFLFVQKESIEKLTEITKNEIEKAFNISSNKNVLNNLTILADIKMLLETNINITKSETNKMFDEKFIKMLKSLNENITSLNNKVPPPLFRPIKYFKFVFSSNNRRREKNEI